MVRQDYCVVALVLDITLKKVAWVHNLPYNNKLEGWGLPAGRVDIKDKNDYMATLKRELLEEAGLVPYERSISLLLEEEMKRGEYIRYFIFAIAKNDGDPGKILYGSDRMGMIVQKIKGWKWHDLFLDPAHSIISVPDPEKTYRSHIALIKSHMRDIELLIDHFSDPKLLIEPATAIG